jgi:hypothetical protein
MADGEQKPTGKTFIAQLLTEAQRRGAQTAPPARGKAYIATLLDQARRARAAQETAGPRCQDCGTPLQWPQDTSPLYCWRCVSRRNGD